MMHETRVREFCRWDIELAIDKLRKAITTAAWLVDDNTGEWKFADDVRDRLETAENLLAEALEMLR